MESYNIKFIAHLTENHQLKAADELISKLQIELGQANSYIEELEETNAQLNKTINRQNERLINQEKQMNKSQSQIVDERILKKNIKIKELEAEIESLKNVRDQLISALNKVRG